jgi:hypothetical protein
MSPNETPRKKWMGEPPCFCDICKQLIKLEFVDGKTVHGPWANMCQSCFDKHGVGLGLGRGQRYVYDAPAGEWFKLEG